MADPYSPNLAGSWNFPGTWNLPVENIYKYKPKIIDIPGAGKTHFWMNNPNKPDTVRLWRGEQIFDTPEDRIKEYKKTKLNAAKRNWYNIRQNNYSGPRTGQWFTNNPSPALGLGRGYGYSQSFGHNKPSYLKYLDVKTKHLPKWYVPRPMDSGRVFIPPTNVINADARGILHNVRAWDPNVFSQEFIDDFKEQKRVRNLSLMGKFFNKIKSTMKGSAGAGMVSSRNTSMGSGNVYSPKIKGMGSPLDDPANFYLAMNTGGIASLML